MKVFLAGATGAMGTQLVPRLVSAGHNVVAMTRRESKQTALEHWVPPRWLPTRSIPTRSWPPWPRRSLMRSSIS